MKKPITKFLIYPIITFFAFLLVLNNSIRGQTFQTSIGYGLPTNELGISGLMTNAGDYLLLANNFNHPNGLFNPSGDMALIRLNSIGALIQPSKIIGQDVGETATWMEKASDCAGNSGYIISGNQFNGPNHAMLLTFTNLSGNPVWVRRIGLSADDERSVCVKQDGAGNFILIGNKTDPNTGQSTIHAVKTDCAGVLLWERVYDLGISATAASVTAFSTFQNACPNSPNAYFVTGKVAAATGGNEEVLIFSINAANGAPLWIKTYDIAPLANDVGTCIQGNCVATPISAGSLWVSGHSLDSNSPDPQMLLFLQTDLNGNPIWANNYDVLNSPLEWATHFQFAANNKLVLTGKAEDPGVSDPPENGHCMLMRVDDKGIGHDWTRVYKQGYASIGNRVEPSVKDEFFIAGNTYEIVAPHQFDYNILAIKTDSLGQTSQTCFHSPETKVIPQQPIVQILQAIVSTPQDFFQTGLQTVLYQEKQTFCPQAPIDPCDTLLVNANFSASVSGNTVSFTDLSTISSGSIFSWTWDFGDGNNSVLQNPTHTYANPGAYIVCLIVSGGTAGAVCRDTFCIDLVIHGDPIDPCDTLLLNANFSFSVSGNTASFTDLSTISSGSIFSWTWDFGDGNNSVLQNPTHTYANPGAYIVCLIIAGGNAGVLCRDTICFDLFIQDIPDPCDSVGLVANFSASISGNTVTFTDLSTISIGTIFSWSWYFGDAGTGFNQNEVHTYSNTGVYTVCLVVAAYGTSSATMCVDTVCFDIEIEQLTDGCLCDSTFLAAVSAGFTTTGTNPIGFTPVALDTCDKVLWIWGDASPNTNSVANGTVFHTYAVAGTYFVCMVVTRNSIDGQVCTFEFCKQITIPTGPKLCEDNIVLNGDFTDGLVPGNLGGPGNLNNWTIWTNTPQVIAGDTCLEAGAVQMWGNQVVGESMQQPVSFVSGGIYEVTMCGKWLNTVQDSVRFRFRASTGLPGSYLNCSGNCDEIFLSPVLTTNWVTYTSAPWTATQNYNTLTISAWNNYNVNDGAFVSWARLDDVCIQRIGTSAITDVQSPINATLYPNPTSGEMVLAFGDILEYEVEVSIMDLTGRVIRKVSIKEGKTSQALSINDCPPGIYLIQAQSNGQEIWSGKVLKH